MWLFDNGDGVYKVFATKELALREVLQVLKKYYYDYPDEKRELEDYRQLMEDYFDPNKDNFYIDEVCWVWKVDYIDK